MRSVFHDKCSFIKGHDYQNGGSPMLRYLCIPLFPCSSPENSMMRSTPAILKSILIDWPLILDMDRATTYLLLVTLLLLILYPKAESHWVHHPPFPPVHRHPLCASQFALANRACAMLPYVPVPDVPTPPTPEPEPEPEPEPTPPTPEPGPTPPTPEPGPTPPSPDGSARRHQNNHGRGHGHGHSHGHGHGHSHGHSRGGYRQPAPIEEDCCRWVEAIDDVCVCELLLHLPPFLVRPVHNYTVVIGACEVTFECGPKMV